MLSSSVKTAIKKNIKNPKKKNVLGNAMYAFIKNTPE